MVIKREVAYGIVHGLSDFWKCEELQDFTVTLGDKHFGCHGLLLAACSGFFRGLFRSGMKETKSRCVTVEDISSETFELILETLYTGHGVLTNDNVIDIWQAAHQLQITFLIKECEYYIIETLSIKNFTKYIHIASLLNSEPVTKMDLVVESEDDVIYAILRWVECKFHDQIESLKGEDSDKTRTSVHVPSTNIDVEKHDTSDKCFTSKEVWKLDPRTGLHDRMSDLPDGCSIWYLMSHEHLILLFYSCLADDLKKTAIECFDTKENTWKRLNNLDGSVTDIVSFKDDHSTYLLQSSGDLWKLIQLNLTL
uniref:BTB domain-containing protein n=1 Tax=Biomphalaria glabrata TaxID=6526 RepID=A0A2C9KLP6_BIOGL